MRNTLLCLLACLALPAFAQMDLQVSPIPLAFSVSGGSYDSRLLTVSNSGTETRPFSLLTQPPGLREHLVSYHPFDAHYNDWVANYSGTPNETWFADDPQGQPLGALAFNGLNSYYPLWDSNLGSTYSVSFRAKPLSSHVLVAEGVYNLARAADYLLWPDWYNSSSIAGLGFALGTNGLMVIEHAAGYMPILLCYSADLSGWNSYVIVFSSHTPKLYVNGVLVRTGITSTRQSSFLSNLMGGGAYGYFEGFVDDYCVYNSALTSAQALAVHQFWDTSSFWAQTRIGSLDPGQSTLLPLRLIDPGLPVGTYSNQYALCQMGLDPQILPLTFTVSQAAGQPQMPQDLSISLDGLGNALLQWTHLSPAPDLYKVYGGQDITRPEYFSYLGSTTGNTFTYSGDPELLSHMFFQVVAFDE